MARALRVMTFNVRGAYRDRRRENAWPNRAAANVEEILRQRPHLIGFQELQRGNLKVYKKRLKGYSYVLGPRYGLRPPWDYNAIFFDHEELEPVGAHGFWLSQTPGRRSRSWGTRVPRSANALTFRRISSGTTFLHLNTHLDHVSPLARFCGTELVIHRLTEREDPVIVTGDFNCRPGSEPYRLFADAGYVDAYLAAGNRDGEKSNTFHNFGGEAYRDRQRHQAPRRLDWVLLRDPRGRASVESCWIPRSPGKGGIYPSDHYPVVAGVMV